MILAWASPFKIYTDGDYQKIDDVHDDRTILFIRNHSILDRPLLVI